MPRLSSLVLSVTLLSTLTLAPGRAHAQTDLDAFMKDVVARRDDNWKKLQQYVLDEREEIALNGPGGVRLWGEQKDYTWFLREGFFIKSPVRANGAEVSEADRRKFEDQYMMRVVRREGRGRPDQPAVDDNAPTNVDSLIRQTRQPQFVSSSYFLRFKFDEGRYALVWRETFEGRAVLRVEYYPTKLYSDDNRRARGRGRQPSDKERRQETELRRLLNKVSLVTLWVEPSTKQIVKYTFDNVDFEFLPAAWLVNVDSVKASMTMSQPFKDVWLPKDIGIGAAMTLAIGQFTFSQKTSFHDYREAKVTSKVIVK